MCSYDCISSNQRRLFVSYHFWEYIIFIKVFDISISFRVSFDPLVIIIVIELNIIRRINNEKEREIHSCHNLTFNCLHSQIAGHRVVFMINVELINAIRQNEENEGERQNERTTELKQLSYIIFASTSDYFLDCN